MVAVYSNARTAICAKKANEAGWMASFNCAFRAVSFLAANPASRPASRAVFLSCAVSHTHHRPPAWLRDLGALKQRSIVRIFCVIN